MIETYLRGKEAIRQSPGRPEFYSLPKILLSFHKVISIQLFSPCFSTIFPPKKLPCSIDLTLGWAMFIFLNDAIF